MKITHELLNKLIAQEHTQRIDERAIPLKIRATPTKTNIDAIAISDVGLSSPAQIKGRSKAAQAKNLKTLVSADGTVTNLSRKDIEAAIEAGNTAPEAETLFSILKSTTDNELRQSIQKELEAIVGAGQQDYKAGTIAKDGADLLKITDFDIEQAQSFTYPRVASSDAAIGSGAFFGSQNELMRSIFSKPTIKERLEEFSTISKKVFQMSGKSLDLTNKREVLQYSMFIDLVNHYINESDSRSGGYLFESLCAQICGGRVSGGSNGVADFETADKSQGSSKLYTDWGDITQSAADPHGVWNVKGSVHYVIGIKQKSKVAEDLKKDEKYIKVDLCYIIITKTAQTDPSTGKPIATYSTSDADGNVLSVQKIPVAKGKRADIIKGTTAERTKVGELTLYSGDNESFKKAMASQIKNTPVEATHKLMQEFFTELFKAEEATKKYIATSASNPEDVVKSGDNAIKSFDKSDGLLVGLLDALAVGDEKVKGGKGQREFSENNKKLTEELLDKMVKQVILESK